VSGATEMGGKFGASAEETGHESDELC
jgi:hypothetical protein